jgi:hypothetical protein
MSLTVVILKGDDSVALEKKVDAVIDERKKYLKSLGAKTFESVYVEDNVARSLENG